MKTNRIKFTRIDNDVNGNPRYVCHFLNLLTKKENGYYDENLEKYIEPLCSVNEKYEFALKRAKTIGGKKYNNKKYGGGIVFQSYNIEDLENTILFTVHLDECKLPS